MTTALALEEQVVYQRPESLKDVPTHYCPGCTHGVAHRLVADEALHVLLGQRQLAQRILVGVRGHLEARAQLARDLLTRPDDGDRLEHIGCRRPCHGALGVGGRPYRLVALPA